jgi:hypothetical protein
MCPMVDERDESRELVDRAFARWQSLMKNWSRRARRSRRMSKLFVYASVVLSVVTTAISGVPAVPRWWIVVASAGTALAAGLMNATKSHEQWTSSREVQNRLYSEKFLYEQAAGVYAEVEGDERTRLFSVRLNDVVMSGHSSWAGHVAEAAAAAKPERP